MKLLKQVFFLSILSLIVSSCGDDSGLTLSLTSPNNDTVYAAGDVISVSGTATDDVEVSTIRIESAELSLNESLMGNGTPTVPFQLDIQIVDGTAAIEEVNLTVTVTDGDGNTVTEDRKVSIQ